MKIDVWYLKHSCTHKMTWIVPASDWWNSELIQELSKYPCPWCGGETGKNKPSPDVDFIGQAPNGPFPMVWKGWNQTHPNASFKAPIPPPDE